MTLANLDAEIGKLNAEIARRAKENDVARRLMTVPGIGPLDLQQRATQHGHRRHDTCYETENSRMNSTAGPH